MWKVKMVRMLTDGVSPDVIVKSGFDYELPRDWSEMLDNIDMVDEAYRNSVFVGVRQHCANQHAASGFYPQELIPPNLQD